MCLPLKLNLIQSDLTDDFTHPDSLLQIGHVKNSDIGILIFVKRQTLIKSYMMILSIHVRAWAFVCLLFSGRLAVRGVRVLQMLSHVVIKYHRLLDF